MEKKKIIIIDDDELITMSLKMILQADDEFEVVAEGHDGSEALPLYEEMKPDIILMDIRMPKMNGLEAAKEVLAKYKDAVILLLTTFSDEEYIVQALKTGVRGYLLKQDYKALPESLRAAMSGQTVFGGAVVERIPDIMQSKSSSFDYSAAGITDKEYAVIQLVAEKKLVHYEEITDNVEREIATYLRDVSKNEMSIGGLARIREFYRVIGEMESLGDSGETIGKILQRVWEHKCHFTDHMLQQLNHLLDLLDDAYVAMDHNLSTPLVEITDIHNAEEAESAINAYRDTLRNEHLTNIEKSSYPYETGSFYMDVVNCIEKMGDFIINISQSVYGAKTV